MATAGLSGEKVDHVRLGLGYGRTAVVPALQCAGDSTWVLVRQCVNDDQNAEVRFAGLKELQGQTDIVVSIARDHDAVLGRSEPKLFIVGIFLSTPADLVDANDIQPQGPRRVRNARIDIFVQ